MTPTTCENTSQGRQRDRVAIDSVEQREQLGTGHALWSAREAIARSGATHTLVLSGDVPNLSASSLERFMSDAASEPERRGAHHRRAR